MSSVLDPFEDEDCRFISAWITSGVRGGKSIHFKYCFESEIKWDFKWFKNPEDDFVFSHSISVFLFPHFEQLRIKLLACFSEKWVDNSLILLNLTSLHLTQFILSVWHSLMCCFCVSATPKYFPQHRQQCSVWWWIFRYSTN